jgi:hypothetical protein
MDRVIIGVDPHKRSVTFEARDTREVLRVVGRCPRPGMVIGRCGRWRGSGRTGSGRSKARTAPAGRSRSGCSPTGNGYWMCRPNSPPGPGCSTPGRVVRPMPPTRTRW